MEHVSTTIFFNGQFWIAVSEKTDSQGCLSVGKYTFGPEPSAAQLLDFYMNRYEQIRFFKTDGFRRIKISRADKEVKRSLNKSLDLFKQQQKEFLSERVSDRRKADKVLEREKYLQKQRKRKEKKRGR